MRKEPSAATVSKLFLCFETKPIVATLLALTLVMLIWNLPPYYQNLLSTTRSCSSSSSSSAPAAVLATTTSLLSTNNNASIPSFTASSSVAVTEKIKYSAAPKPTDPNTRVFQSYGNAAALFVLMGAYRGGPSTFAVAGLASKPIHVFGRPWYKCEWISNNGSSYRAKAYKMLPDWGYGRVYTVVVVNCTFPFNPNQDNVGSKLMVNAYYGESPRKFEKFTALEESPGSYAASVDEEVMRAESNHIKCTNILIIPLYFPISFLLLLRQIPS